MNSKRAIITPLEGGLVDTISPLFRYEKPLLGPGSFNEVNLILQNNTEEKLEGWLKIIPPADWILEPGNTLMIAIRPQKFLMAEFYLSVPEVPTTDSHFLDMEVTLEEGLVAKATFDLSSSLLFVVDK